jgi:hypothetical protein
MALFSHTMKGKCKYGLWGKTPGLYVKNSKCPLESLAPVPKYWKLETKDACSSDMGLTAAPESGCRKGPIKIGQVQDQNASQRQKRKKTIGFIITLVSWREEIL